MSWLRSGVAARAQAAELKAPPSLEFPTMVSARGIAPANAVVEHLNTAECRFRTVVFFDHHDVVEFAIGGEAERPIFVRGTVTSRANNGPRFVYRLRLDRMSAKEIDELARRVAGIQQRQAVARREEAVRNLPVTDRLTRASHRVTTQFPIAFRTPKHEMRQAKAGDVSAGGLLMISSDSLSIGEPIELRFTLPSHVLNVYPEETVAIDLRNARVSVPRNDQRRKFAEMTIGARVVACREVGGGSFAYGIAFSSIDGFQREEIARYTNAVQRSRNRHR